MSEWISVKDRLPSRVDGERVLFHTVERWPQITVGRCEGSAFVDETEWYGEEGYPTPVAATHWMPLPPEPPGPHEPARQFTAHVGGMIGESLIVSRK